MQSLAYVLENLGLDSWERKEILCSPKHPVPPWDPVSLLPTAAEHSLPGGTATGRAVHTHVHVVPRQRMRAATRFPLPHNAFITCTATTGWLV